MTLRALLRGPLALLALLSTVVPLGLPSAGAQSPEDLRTQAEAIEERLASLRDEIELLVDQLNQAQAEADAAQGQLDIAGATLAALEREQQQRRALLANFAVEAYVRAGSNGAGFLDARTAAEVGVRSSYLRTTSGDQQDLLDGLRAARSDVERQQARLADARQRSEARLEALAKARADVDARIAEEAEVLNATQGRLAELVAEARAQRAAEEARAASEARLAALTASAGPLVAPLDPADAGQVPGSNVPAAGAPPATTGPPTPAEPAAPATPVTPPVPAVRPEAKIAVEAALSQVGVPYVFGGASPAQGFDCSGLIYWAWAQAGRRISRPADWQRDDTIAIRYEDLQPGDLIFYGEPVSHDAMYIGNDLIVNAPYTGEYVRVQSMWYSSKPMTYGRVP
jgi:cell wall-associated NlpC family hydrolase